jgi:hypothetical protein
MATSQDLKQKLTDTGMQLLDIATATATIAGVTAGLPFPLPEDIERPARNYEQAAALSSTAQNIISAAYGCADALAKLETAYPTP